MILLTGAAGLSGRKILGALGEAGLPVRALVRGEARAQSLRAPAGVEVAIGDMARPGTLAPALDGVETAIVISTADERMAHTQMAFVDAARAAGVRRIVKFSGQEAGIGFDAAAFRFTRMHEEVERHIERSGLRWTHLRPSQFMQVYLREAASVARDGVIALPLGDVEVAPVDLDDVARIMLGVVRATDVDAAALQVTGPQALGMAEVARILGERLGRPVRYEPITIEERSRRLLAAGTPPVFVEALEEQAAERLRRPRAAVAVAAHRRFGVEPTTFASFVSRHLQAFAAPG